LYHNITGSSTHATYEAPGRSNGGTSTSGNFPTATSVEWTFRPCGPATSFNHATYYADLMDPVKNPGIPSTVQIHDVIATEKAAVAAAKTKTPTMTKLGGIYNQIVWGEYHLKNENGQDVGIVVVDNILSTSGTVIGTVENWSFEAGYTPPTQPVGTAPSDFSFQLVFNSSITSSRAHLSMQCNKPT
jgi:hypothetical protein